MVTVHEGESHSKVLCDKLRHDYDIMKEENRVLIKKWKGLNFFQRRNNTNLFGLEEEKGENIYEKLVTLFNSRLEPADNFNNRRFERAHRLGCFSDKTNRPVGFKASVWETKLKSILDGGLWAKFYKNEKFAKILLDTGTDIITEANKFDSLGSVGLVLIN